MKIDLLRSMKKAIRKTTASYVLLDNIALLICPSVLFFTAAAENEYSITNNAANEHVHKNVLYFRIVGIRFLLTYKFRFAL